MMHVTKYSCQKKKQTSKELPAEASKELAANALLELVVGAESQYFVLMVLT